MLVDSADISARNEAAVQPRAIHMVNEGTRKSGGMVVAPNSVGDSPGSSADFLKRIRQLGRIPSGSPGVQEHPLVVPRDEPGVGRERCGDGDFLALELQEPPEVRPRPPVPSLHPLGDDDPERGVDRDEAPVEGSSVVGVRRQAAGGGEPLGVAGARSFRSNRIGCTPYSHPGNRMHSTVGMTRGTANTTPGVR